MNTKQLIIFWNGSFILFIVLFFISQSRAFYSNEFLVPIFSVLAVIAGITLLFFTYRDSSEIDRKKVFKKGIIPIPLVGIIGLGIALIIGLILTNNGSFWKSNLKSQIEIFQPDYNIKYNRGNIDKTIFSGRIKNNSNEEITELSIRIRIYKYNFSPPDSEPGEFSPISDLFPPWGRPSIYLKSISEDSLKFVGNQIDTEDLQEYNLNIPAKETKSFEIVNNYPEIEPSNYWAWDYEVISAY